MGQTIYLIGAAVLAGTVILLVLQMQFLMSDSGIESSMNRYVQSTAETFKQILRIDIKDVGMAMPRPDESLQVMQPNELEYKVNRDPATAQIYTINIKTKPWETGNDPTPQNPNDFQVIKTVTDPDGNSNEDPYPVTGVAVTSVSDTIFWYYDDALQQVSNPKQVRYIRFRFKLESKEPFKGEFIYSIVEERIFLKNVWQF